MPKGPLVLHLKLEPKHPWPLDLGKRLAHLPKFIAAEGDGLDGRHHDLSNANAIWVAVEKENVD